MLTDFNKTEPDEEMDDAAQRQTALKKLVKIVVKSFYEPVELMIVDLIIRENYISQDRLANELKLEARKLHEALSFLKNDKIIQMVSIKKYDSEAENGKKKRAVQYFFINYEDVVNVVRFKLEKVRKGVRYLEKDLAEIPSFQCTVCGKRWSDVEAGELFDLKTFKLQCFICQGKIKDDTSEVSPESRDHMARFNQQTDPIYFMLREIDSRI